MIGRLDALDFVCHNLNQSQLNRTSDSALTEFSVNNRVCRQHSPLTLLLTPLKALLYLVLQLIVAFLFLLVDLVHFIRLKQTFNRLYTFFIQFYCSDFYVVTYTNLESGNTISLKLQKFQKYRPPHKRGIVLHSEIVGRYSNLMPIP